MIHRNESRRASHRLGPCRSRRPWRRGARRRAVSEVVATIILLALTVVLFGTIFAWVTTFPPPIQQNVTQFSANMVLTANQTYVKALQITHLAGPAVLAGATYVYLKSAYHPGAPEFQTPIPVAPYLPNSVTWNLGQTFNYTFPCSPGACEQPQLPDNLTVLVVSNSQLVFSTILPGTPIAVPPNFVETGVSPANPAEGASFTITATVSGSTSGSTVYVNLANIPGLATHYPQAVKMTYSAASNQWSFTVPASMTTANGTYYAFVNITNPVGQSATAGVAVTLSPSSSGGGGGGGSSSLSVAVLVTPEFPPSFGVNDSLAAIVTYLGTGSNIPLSVSFWANQSIGSAGGGWDPLVTANAQLNGPTGLSISGPSTVTVYSVSTYSGWLINASVQATTVASLSGVGSATGTAVFNSSNAGVSGITYLPGSCNYYYFGTSCPAPVVTVWNNASIPITYSGHAIISSGGTQVTVFTVPNHAVPVGSSRTWRPTSYWQAPNYGAYTVTAELRLVNSSTGTPIGYLVLTYPFSV